MTESNITAMPNTPKALLSQMQASSEDLSGLVCLRFHGDGTISLVTTSNISTSDACMGLQILTRYVNACIDRAQEE